MQSWSGTRPTHKIMNTAMSALQYPGPAAQMSFMGEAAKGRTTPLEAGILKNSRQKTLVGQKEVLQFAEFPHFSLRTGLEISQDVTTGPSESRYGT